MNSSCRRITWEVVKVARATWTVQASRSWPITRGQRKEFQAPMKTIVPTAAKTGRELGTTTRQYVRQWPSPSTRAASSSSLGKPRKYWRKMKQAKAEKRVGTIRPRRVDTQPSDETRTKLGTNVTAAGTIIVPRIAWKTRSAWRYGMRARPYPASEARTRVPRVVATAISTELSRACAMGTVGSAKSSDRFEKRSVEGKSVQSGDVISSSEARPLRRSR
ncbi:hypothetical protein SALBM135S_04679 [Streptomyces alboniger]